MGTGAAYVALLVVAAERFRSPLAVTLVLLCELAPAMALGPVLGALADRWPRRALLVGADLLRAAAFVGIALAGTIEATVAFALLAGLGQAAFQPTVMAALPDAVSAKRLPAATSLFGALDNLGFIVGPALAARPTRSPDRRPCCSPTRRRSPSRPGSSRGCACQAGPRAKPARSTARGCAGPWRRASAPCARTPTR
ncbi:MAG: MFS transporter [Actinomycetota bacterium]|nr:MFS transporter [Actinomycetota bacterium]